MSGRCSFARASGLEASGVLAQFLAPDALEIVRDALRSEEAWIRFLQPSSRMGEHAARLRVRALLFDPSLPRACDSSDAARVDPDGWGASLGSDVAGWARASVRLPHDDVYHTLEEDEEDWERARAAGALPSRRDRPDVSAPRASPSHTAPRVRLDVDVLDDAARVRLSIAATEDAAPRGARDKNPLATAVARDDDDPTTRAWRDATARIRVARVDAARASVAEDELVPSPAASTRLAPPPRTPAGMRAFLLGEDSFEDVGRANRYPELAGVRSTVPPFPSTTARKRRASCGETRPGVYEPSATSTSARAVAMSEVDAFAALARVVAEALLRPTNTLNGYDLSGWPDQTSTPVVERDEESATATTMAAESAAVDALAAAAGNLARSIATRLRVALDARVTRTRAEARRIESNGTSAAPVVTPCVATLAARAAVAGGEATFSSLVEYRRRGALERGRLAARAATATASARVKTEVHAVDAAVDAGRTSAPSSAAVAPSAATELLLANILGFASRSGSPSVTPPLGHPGRVSSPNLPAHDAFVVSNQSTAAAAAAVAPSAATEFLLANILGFASRPGSPSVTPPLGHLGRVSSPHLPAHDAFVVSNQSTAAAATGTTSAPVAANGSRLAGEQLASLHAQFRAEGIQRDAANARRYELLVRQQMAAMRHQDMGQGIGQGMGLGMGGSATAGEERMFAPPRPMSPGTHVVAARKREGTAAGEGAAKRGRLD